MSSPGRARQPLMETLGDYSIGHWWVDFSCLKCMREVWRPAYHVEGWPERTIADVRNKARCAECGSTSISIKPISHCEAILAERQRQGSKT